ncbi:TrbC/VirB2 family protein [Qipengyuania nanhaisediminis]|uniref:TrbC/VirB2 family protein n=1 Tax=Qipengyuania nanhaisediminis TaxID=604088 RepID=UPI0038B2A3D0
MISPLFRNAARLAATLAPLALASAAHAGNVAGNAAQSGDPITSALVWMQSILLGPIATALAVMAIAGVGFMMLTGRMNWRYGATVIIGVFIIFGAPRLVATIQAI